MLNSAAWKPWHEVVQLRAELKDDTKSLSSFAADLYSVAMDNAEDMYRDPQQFFSLTYPTANLLAIAKDVLLRLAGQSDKAIRQLAQTYGGGKTHTLITLFHLARDPMHLPDQLIGEFRATLNYQAWPPARIAILAFDQLDSESGMIVRSPQGEERWLKYPWSVLAFQIAGSDGLRLLHSEDRDEERDSVPAANLLTMLLALPADEGLSTLILMDEVMMYVYEKAVKDSTWGTRLTNFFQYLTQAATKVRRCAMVVSLLASDINKDDVQGKMLREQISNVFGREREAQMQPVEKEDVAEVLYRRFFEPKSDGSDSMFRAQAIAAAQGIAALDQRFGRDEKAIQEDLLKSYPFHPDLTEVLYGKWSNLEGFQLARGVLRIFALALRDAQKWDRSPLIAANVFLGAPEREGLSEAAQELASIAAMESQEGTARKQEWPVILQGELSRARQVQEGAPLRFREVEQAVFVTFLHSQPAGQMVRTPELMILLGHTRPDRIVLEQALLEWTAVSWFLDESTFRQNEKGEKLLPQSWRLGLEPNLQQMFFETSRRISEQLIDGELEKEIRACNSLIAGANLPGVQIHRLPKHIDDVKDEPQYFHYAVLGPDAASEEGQPSPEAQRFIDTKTDSGVLRVYRNAVLLAVPSTVGIQDARNAIRAYLGWLEVDRQLKEQLKDRKLELGRKQLLDSRTEQAGKNLPQAVRRAYSVFVTVSNQNKIEAFRLILDSEKSLFNAIKNDERARIREQPVDAAALLPGGPYNIWHEEDSALKVSELLDAFPHFAHLPKMLNRKTIIDTLLEGCRQGIFVLRSTRGDQSQRTYWREELDSSVAQTLDLEVIQSTQATLDRLAMHLLEPGVLPALWQGSELALEDLYSYFTVQVLKVFHEEQNYTEYLEIPRCSRDVINVTVREAVKEQYLWLVAGRAGFLGEEVPFDLLSDEATLQSPLPRYVVEDILPEKLPDAWWEGAQTTASAISDALAIKASKPLPWLTIQRLIEAAFQGKLLELAQDSGPWPCNATGAQEVKLNLRQDKKIAQKNEKRVQPPTSTRSTAIVDIAESRPLYPPSQALSVLVAEANLNIAQMQELGDQLPDLAVACAEFAGTSPSFRLRLELAPKSQLTTEQVDALNRILEMVSNELKLR